MKTGDIVKVINGNHPFAGCSAVVISVDGTKVSATVTKASGYEEDETFEAAELSEDQEAEVVSDATLPRRPTDVETAAEKKANAPATGSPSGRTPPANPPS